MKTLARTNPIRDALHQLHALIGDEYPYDTEKSISHDYDSEDAFFDVIDEVVNRLIGRYGVSEEEAFKFTAKVSNLLEPQGIMPLFPCGNATEADLVRWTTTARVHDFGNYVMREAKRKYNEKESMMGARSAKKIYKKLY